MIKRVKKEEWKKALSSLSERNRFRPIEVEDSAHLSSDPLGDLYFLGIRFRGTDAKVTMEVYVCRPQEPRGGFLLASVASPSAVSIDETPEDGVKLISVTHGKQQKFRIRFSGPPSSKARIESIAKIAYFLYERRGGLGGSELEDWADAERHWANWEELIDLKFI